MSHMNVAFEQLSRKQFNEISDRIEEDRELNVAITLYYDGTNLYGRVVMNCNGSQTMYNRALMITTEVITKKKA